MNDEDRLNNVSFEEQISNPKYIKPLRMNFERRGLKLQWEMSFTGDSSNAIVYHSDRKQLLFVKQFRPAVFVRKIMRLPENKGKKLSEVDFEKYPLNIGMTIEPCGGLMDKPGLGPKEVIIEEIYEELGFRAKPENLEFIQTFTGVGSSGCEEHLYFATVDESDCVTSGGGNLHEGEIIEKVYVDLDKLDQVMNRSESIPAIFNAVWWFMLNKQDLIYACSKH